MITHRKLLKDDTIDNRIDNIDKLLSSVLKASSAVNEIVEYMERLGADKIADVYDNDDFPSDALFSLIPGYEYPDISYLTIKDLLKM